jgi:hypothetical protein
MNLNPLFTSARVITAVYRITSTAILLYYIGRRALDGRKLSRDSRSIGARAYRRSARFDQD